LIQAARRSNTTLSQHRGEWKEQSSDDRFESRTITVKEDEQGLRLDQFLCKRFSDISRNEWQTRIDQGYVKINELQARPSRRLNVHDCVRYAYYMRAEPETPLEIPVIYEDENLIAVDKPAGLPVHPSGIYRTKTVTTLLDAQNNFGTTYLLHRLDRETSGVLLLARNKKSAALYHKALRSDSTKKEYVVLCEGKFPKEFQAHGYLFSLPSSRLKRKRFFSIEPPAEAIDIQTAQTNFTRLYTRKHISALRAVLLTGRMHQIRATLLSLGFPVVGDKLYGVDEDYYFKFADDTLTEADWVKLRLRRSALHCTRLTVINPFTEEPLTIESKVPADMELSE